MRERNYICKGRWRQNSAGEWMQHQDGQTLVVFLSGGKYVLASDSHERRRIQSGRYVRSGEGIGGTVCETGASDVSILFAVAILTATESTWTVDRPLVEIVRAIKQNLDDPSAQLPPDMVRLLSAVDLTATLYARPREHYYRCEFSAGYRKLRIVKTLEVWGRGQQTVVRSTVSITRDSRCRIVAAVVERITPLLERKVLEFEAEQLRRVSRAKP